MAPFLRARSEVHKAPSEAEQHEERLWLSRGGSAFPGVLGLLLRTESLFLRCYFHLCPRETACLAELVKNCVKCMCMVQSVLVEWESGVGES